MSTTLETELLAGLARVAAHHPLPRVRALHLPPLDAPNDTARDRGEFCALELEDGALGLAYVLLDDTLARLHAETPGLGLAGSDPLVLARAAVGGQGLVRTLGLAAINALSRHVFDRAGYVPPRSTDSIGQVDPQPGERIGMVGYFRPLAKRIAEVGARLVVLELDAALVGEHPDCTVTLDPAALGCCPKVLCTASTLINGSLDRMLKAAASARHFALIGPGAGCLPDALFAHGVTLMGGNWIADGPAFVDALRRGEGWSGHGWKFAIERGHYPGLDALLAGCPAAPS